MGERTWAPIPVRRKEHVIKVESGVVHAWEVSMGAAEDGSAPMVIFLHGGTWSGRPNFGVRFVDDSTMEHLACAAIAADPDSPNGVFRDDYANLPIIDTDKLVAPTLVIAGEHEASHSIEDMTALFEALPTMDKQLAVIPGGGHAVHLEMGRYQWRSTVLEFLAETRAR